MKTFKYVAVFALVCYSAAQAEDWPGINKDGAGRNASTVRIATPLQLRWAKEIKGLSTTLSRKGIIAPTARRSNNLSIRGGQILTVVGSNVPSTQYASFGIWSLSTGDLLSSVLSPHLGPVYTAGEVDATDLIGGLITHYWSQAGDVYTMHGGDESKNSVFNPWTGSIPPDFGQAKTRYYKLAPNPLDATWVTHSVDASGWFSFSEENPMIAVTGNYGSASAGLQQPVIVGKGMTSLGNGWAGGYNLGYVIASDTVYSLKPINPRFGGLDHGTTLVAYSVAPGTASFPVGYKAIWTYTDPLTGYMSRDGGPRALALGDGDNRVYFYGQPLGPYVYDPSMITADWKQSTVLVGINRGTGTQEVRIPSGYLMGSESSSDAARAVPQIAVLGSKVVVFQPQQGMLKGHVMCFDVANKKLAWRYNYAASAFQRSVALGASEMAEQATQMVVSGDAVYVVEPRITSGVLGLRVYRFSLATGGTPLISNFSLGLPASQVGTIALREVAAVDGTLVALIDYDYLHQALAVISGPVQ